MITLIIIFYLAAIIAGLSIGYIVYTKNTMQDRVQKEYSTRLESYQRALRLKIDWEKPDYKEISRTHELKFAPKRIFAKILFSIMLVIGFVLGIYINTQTGISTGFLLGIIELAAVILLAYYLINFKALFHGIATKFQNAISYGTDISKGAKLLTWATLALFVCLSIAISVSAGMSSTFSLDFVGVVTIWISATLITLTAFWLAYLVLYCTYKLLNAWLKWLKS